MRWIRNRRKAVENWLGPFLSGLIEGLIAPLALAAVFWTTTEWISVADPSPEVFRDLADVGAAVFIAFAVATAGAAAFTGGNLKLHLNWLGSACGVGLSGFFGILASVALAAYREAGHASWLDLFGLFWILAGITLLGSLVAALPYAAFNWSRQSSSST